MIQYFDTIIIGAGFAGAVSAEICASRNKKVLVVEQKNHIGGNCYDSYDENGLLIHNYGPHIFHTEHEDVWQYLNNFTDWIPYQHRVLGLVDGQYVPIPFNLKSMEAIFPKYFAKQLEKKLIKIYGFGNKVTILELYQKNDQDFQELANYVYNKVFLGYTQKQWGVRPEDIDPQITARVPIIIAYDDRYFQDKYQGIPREGYTSIFKKLLNHPNIKLMLNTNIKEICNIDEINKKLLFCGKNFEGDIIYTGPLDELFDYRYGALSYRGLDFRWKIYDQSFCQPTAVINYPSNYDYTRTTEYKHFNNQDKKKTIISHEYPKDCQLGQDIPYYPILDQENRELYAKYKSLADSYKNLLCLGRLAEFKYYDMDDIVKKY